MKKIKRTDLVIIAVLLAAIIGITLIILSGRSGRSTSAEQIDADNAITAEDYNGKRIGIKTGSSFEEISFDKFPDSEYFYFDNYSDMTTALKSKKINGFLTDDSALTGENGTLNIVTLDYNAPFSYFADNKIKGYAIELVTVFARMKKRSETKHYNKAII